MKIDLFHFSGPGESPFWELGNVVAVEENAEVINSLIKEAINSTATDALLFWDLALGSPDPNAVRKLFESPGDIWHAGLKLGTRGLPQAVDFVHPTWMLNCDPDIDIAAASWRLSLRACMVRADVLRQMGGLRSGFQSLQGAALELGHRLVKRGVMMRYAPEMTATIEGVSEDRLAAHDELLFAKYRFPSFWYRWTVFRLLCSGAIPRIEVLKHLKRIASIERKLDPQPFDNLLTRTKRDGDSRGKRVTVLLPTIDRYAYLKPLLQQLRQQTVAPSEIVVIDQTPVAARDRNIVEEFNDLPLIWIEQDKAGQCSSRNAGLHVSTGDFILFLDDDDEIAGDLIERHLESLEFYRADVSSGVANEVGAGDLPETFTFTRQSDVFPTNNTMIRRKVLFRSGLFDLAYDRGKRADGDLGMRIYLSGNHMVLNSDISVLHHRAPMGGLRTHGQRVVTRATSRKSLTQVNLASRYDIYLAKRYFSPRQVRELLWISAFSTLSVSGSVFRKVLKALLSIAMLPISVVKLIRRNSEVREMLEQFPQIDVLSKNNAVGKG